MMERNVLKSALKQRLLAQIKRENPTLDALLRTSEPNWNFIRGMAIQSYQLTRHFLSYVEALYYYCPLPEFKLGLLENLYEETTGRISGTDNHVALMENFLRAIGVSEQERDETVPLPETRELIDYRREAVGDPGRYHIGAAAVLIASEGQNLGNQFSEERIERVRAQFGLTKADMLFFTVHREEDVGHVNFGLDLVSKICTTEAMQQEALHAVTYTSDLFARMYLAIGRELRKAGHLLQAS